MWALQWYIFFKQWTFRSCILTSTKHNQTVWNGWKYESFCKYQWHFLFWESDRKAWNKNEIANCKRQQTICVCVCMCRFQIWMKQSVNWFSFLFRGNVSIDCMIQTSVCMIRINMPRCTGTLNHLLPISYFFFFLIKKFLSKLIISENTLLVLPINIICLYFLDS